MTAREIDYVPFHHFFFLSTSSGSTVNAREIDYVPFHHLFFLSTSFLSFIFPEFLWFDLVQGTSIIFLWGDFEDIVGKMWRVNEQRDQREFEAASTIRRKFRDINDFSGCRLHFWPFMLNPSLPSDLGSFPLSSLSPLSTAFHFSCNGVRTWHDVQRVLTLSAEPTHFGLEQALTYCINMSEIPSSSHQIIALDAAIFSRRRGSLKECFTHRLHDRCGVIDQSYYSCKVCSGWLLELFKNLVSYNGLLSMGHVTLYDSYVKNPLSRICFNR